MSKPVKPTLLSDPKSHVAGLATITGSNDDDSMLQRGFRILCVGRDAAVNTLIFAFTLIAKSLRTVSHLQSRRSKYNQCDQSPSFIRVHWRLTQLICGVIDLVLVW